MTVFTSGPWGNTGTGTTSDGPNGPTGNNTAVTKIKIWYNSGNYIYGYKLWWGATSATYGNTNSGTTFGPLDITGTPFDQVSYGLDSSTPANFVRNEMWFYNTGQMKQESQFDVGDTSVALTQAFTSTNTLALTDIEVWTTGTGANKKCVAIEFWYSDHWTMSFKLYREMALPALGLMANAMVVAKSLMKVGKLRDELNVKAPSCEPPAGTDPLKVELWHRTFRAQENCKEFFLLFAPTIMVAAVFGQEAFGNWVPKTVGALSLVGAFFRYKYMKAYIQDADKRGPPFRYAKMSMAPVFYLAIASCGYLVGKQLYCHLKSCHKKSSNQEEY